MRRGKRKCRRTIPVAPRRRSRAAVHPLSPEGECDCACTQMAPETCERERERERERDGRAGRMLLRLAYPVSLVELSVRVIELYPSHHLCSCVCSRYPSIRLAMRQGRLEIRLIHSLAPVFCWASCSHHAPELTDAMNCQMRIAICSIAGCSGSRRGRGTRKV